MAELISNRLKDHPIPAFFLLTFAIAWSIWLPLGVFAPERYLLILLGVWAPTFSALILIGLAEGRSGIQQFLKGLIRWRVGGRWYLVSLFGPAVIACLAIGIGRLSGLPAPAFTTPDGMSRDMLFVFLPVIFLVNIFVGGPLAEDIGWRGYLIPKIRGHMPAFHASLVVGVIWAIWHIPFFIFPGWREIVGNIPFFWFLLLTTSWSVLFAWVYVNTASILMPVLFHAAINTTLGTLGLLGQGNGSPIFLMVNTLLTWIVVGIILILYGWDLNQADWLHAKQTTNAIS